MDEPLGLTTGEAHGLFHPVAEARSRVFYAYCGAKLNHVRWEPMREWNAPGVEARQRCSRCHVLMKGRPDPLGRLIVGPEKERMLRLASGGSDG